jgi:hypothetical protein
VRITKLDRRGLAKVRVAEIMADVAGGGPRISEALAALAYGPVPPATLVKLRRLGLTCWDNGTRLTDAGRVLLNAAVDA